MMRRFLKRNIIKEAPPNLEMLAGRAHFSTKTHPLTALLGAAQSTLKSRNLLIEKKKKQNTVAPNYSATRPLYI